MTFSSCYNLTSIPETLFKNCKKVYSFYETFGVCKKLTTLPENLFTWCPDVTDFGWTFWACENLTYVPTGLFDNNRKVLNFDYIFSGCNLSGESPYTIVDGVKYHLYDRYKNPDYFITPRTFNGSFEGCYQLSDREEISANGWGLHL